MKTEQGNGQSAVVQDTAYTCPVCDTARPSVAWTDTHGVAQCIKCGCAVRVYFYEGNRRIDNPPQCPYSDESVSVLRRYRADRPGRRFPSGFAFGLGPNAKEVCSGTDAMVFHEWCKDNWKREHRP